MPLVMRILKSGGLADPNAKPMIWGDVRLAGLTQWIGLEGVALKISRSDEVETTSDERRDGENLRHELKQLKKRSKSEGKALDELQKQLDHTVEVARYHWKHFAAGDGEGGLARGLQAPKIGAFEIRKTVDSASAYLFRWVAREVGDKTALAEVRRDIEIRAVRPTPSRTGEKQGYEPIVSWKLADCIPVDHSLEFDSGDDLPDEKLTVRAASVQIFFHEYDQTGRQSGKDESLVYRASDPDAEN
jgi:type VI protein secretion system component Hcp